MPVRNARARKEERPKAGVEGGGGCLGAPKLLVTKS